MTKRGVLRKAIRGGAVALMALALPGCVTVSDPYFYAFRSADPRAVFPVDEFMSCEAMTASFRFAARRAARLEYWIEFGPIAGFGYSWFGADAPLQLRYEFQRMDELSDVQRYRGCRVMDPVAEVASERARLQPPPPPRNRPPVLTSKG